MKTISTFAALAVGANALALRGDSCCFKLTASGGASGTVGQLNDGQNRIGGGLPPATYCISPDGTITDSSGRGCILTPPTTQFQCDTGATPTPGFSISSSGELASNGSSDFVACQTGDNGELNIYTNPPPNDVSGCVHITLQADNCAPPASTPTPSPSVVVVTVTETQCIAPTTGLGQSTTNSPPPAKTTSSWPPQSSACSTNLVSGSYEFPHLIVPIDSSSPNTAFGTKYNGQVTSTISSIFNFDIPPSDSGKTCSLVFLFPEQKDLQTSSYQFSGDGKVDFSELSSTATQSTTYNNAPSVKTDYGVTTVAPGHSYVIATFPCPSGQSIAFEMKEAGTTDLTYFQDYNPSPIGLYITTC